MKILSRESFSVLHFALPFFALDHHHVFPPSRSSHNPLVAALPASIANLSNLEILNLFNNHLDELPTSLSSMSKLKILNVGWVFLSSSATQSIILFFLFLIQSSSSWYLLHLQFHFIKKVIKPSFLITACFNLIWIPLLTSFYHFSILSHIRKHDWNTY